MTIINCRSFSYFKIYKVYLQLAESAEIVMTDNSYRGVLNTMREVQIYHASKFFDTAHYLGMNISCFGDIFTNATSYFVEELKTYKSQLTVNSDFFM